MRPPARTFQMFSLLIGAIALVLSSAGLVGASPVEGEDAPGNSASAMPEHAAEKQGGPNHVDDEVDDDDNTKNGDESTNDGVEDGESAHPSGNDRLVEPGNSGTQGKSPSDPDGMTNGGADKPEGEGGTFTGDQDGNNGCGNDQDFEDDNNGLCLGPDGAPGQQVDDDEGSNPDDDDTNTGDEDDSDVDDGDGDNNAGGADKVTICHATGSDTNPYNLITVSVNSILNPAGHDDHEDDIIPAFEGFDGQGDVDLIEAGCEVDDDTNTGDEDDSDVDDGDEDNNAGGADKVTLCHATGSETNPYVVITVSENAVLSEGHDGHEGDVIPAFGDYPGKNLDAEGLIAADCEVDDETEENPENPENPIENPENPIENPENPIETPDEVEGVDEDRDEDVGGEVVVNIPVTPANPTVTPVTPASPAVEVVADRTPRVLGSQVTRTSQLPRTGDETTNLVPFGLGLVLLGFGLQRTSKRFSAARAS